MCDKDDSSSNSDSGLDSEFCSGDDEEENMNQLFKKYICEILIMLTFIYMRNCHMHVM